MILSTGLWPAIAIPASTAAAEAAKARFPDCTEFTACRAAWARCGWMNHHELQPRAEAGSQTTHPPVPALWTHRLVRRAVSFELLVVRELDVDGLSTQHGRH